MNRNYDETYDSILKKVKNTIDDDNTYNQKSIINGNDGDNRIAMFSINQGKKSKDSLTARSRQNKNLYTHFGYIKKELDKEEKKYGWWEKNIDLK